MELRVGQSYKLSFQLNCVLANILLTKWSCANIFYVLIGSTICQLFVKLIFWKVIFIFFYMKQCYNQQNQVVNFFKAIAKNNYKKICYLWRLSKRCNRHHRMINTIVYCCRNCLESIMFVYLACNQLICVILEWQPSCFTPW